MRLHLLRLQQQPQRISGPKPSLAIQVPPLLLLYIKNFTYCRLCSFIGNTSVVGANRDINVFGFGLGVEQPSDQQQVLALKGDAKSLADNFRGVVIEQGVLVIGMGIFRVVFVAADGRSKVLS